MGFWEAMTIFIVVLLLFGKGKAIEVARTIGEAVREFNRARAEFERAASAVAAPQTYVKEKALEGAKEVSWAKDLYEVAIKLGVDCKNKSVAEVAKEIAKKLSEERRA